MRPIFLAERLPTVPNKPDVDAAGNAKPGAANGTATGTAAANGRLRPLLILVRRELQRRTSRRPALRRPLLPSPPALATTAPGSNAAGSCRKRRSRDSRCNASCRDSCETAERRPEPQLRRSRTARAPDGCSIAGERRHERRRYDARAEASQAGSGSDTQHESAAACHAACRRAAAAMSSRVMPFRGSLTSRDQVAVYEFSWPAVIFIPLVAVLIQIFIPVRVRFLPIIDLPFMVTIFFAVARRNPISGCLTGCVIGLMQDLFAGPSHPLGMYGIALTIIGYMASSLGLKIDVENPGSRFIITYIFFVAPPGRSTTAWRTACCARSQEWSWSHVAISALANAVIGIFVFKFLDRFKER